jgi:hypothetical protein
VASTFHQAEILFLKFLPAFLSHCREPCTSRAEVIFVAQAHTDTISTTTTHTQVGDVTFPIKPEVRLVSDGAKRRIDFLAPTGVFAVGLRFILCGAVKM